MKIVETKIQKFRSVTSANAQGVEDFFCTISKEGLQFWNTKNLHELAEEAKDDMILSCQPERSIKLNQMILCCAITQIVDIKDNQAVKEKAKKKDKKVAPKQIKKKKLSKDERKILKLQKLKAKK